MKQVFAKAALTAIFSTAVSLILVLTFVPDADRTTESVAVKMAILCPLVISFPASAYLFYQKHRLADTLEALTTAHQQLAQAHTELADAHAKLSEVARHDDMTGLLNRKSFLATLKAARRHSDGGALLVIDADHFKQINDTYGHGQGDIALSMIAAAIGEGVRERDLVGRIGGEEFAALLHGASNEDALLVAERIRQNVEALRFSPRDGQILPLTVSIGGTHISPGLTVSKLMREADNRLYQAKAGGRNQIVFGDPMLEKVA